MMLGLVLLFIALPLVELAILIIAGQHIGVWPTLGIVIGTAIAGGLVLSRQSWKAYNRAMESSAEGKLPVDPVIDGTFLILAGVLLLLPGLISDTLGAMLLVGPVRRWIGRRLFKTLVARGNIHVQVRTRNSSTGEAQAEDLVPHMAREDRAGRPPDGRGMVIDADFETVENTKSSPPDQAGGRKS